MVGNRFVPHGWNRTIPERDSKVFALAAWANEQERKLLGLHCGQMLDHKRHREWAEGVIA